MIQVVADATAGINQFKADYPSHVARADGTVPDDAGEWRILIGEADDLIEEDAKHPGKVVARLASFKGKQVRQDKEAADAREKAKETAKK